MTEQISTKRPIIPQKTNTIPPDNHLSNEEKKQSPGFIQLKSEPISRITHIITATEEEKHKQNRLKSSNHPEEGPIL